MNLEGPRQLQHDLWNRMQQIVHRAEREGRDLTAEELADFERTEAHLRQVSDAARDRFAAGGVIPGPERREYVLTADQVGPLGREARRALCSHTGAVPVESVVDSELLAWLCPSCDAQLPAEWRAWKDPYDYPLYQPPAP